MCIGEQPARGPVWCMYSMFNMLLRTPLAVDFTFLPTLWLPYDDDEKLKLPWKWKRGVWSRAAVNTNTQNDRKSSWNAIFFIVTLKTSNLVSVSMRVSGWRAEPRRAQKTKEKTRKEQEREKKGEDNFVFSLTNFSGFTSKIVGFGAAVTCHGVWQVQAQFFIFSHHIFLLNDRKNFHIVLNSVRDSRRDHVARKELEAERSW